MDFSLPEEIFSTFSDQIPTFEGNSPFLAAFGTLFPRKSPVFPSFQEIGEDIFVKDTFLAVFVQKSGRTVTFLYEIGYFMGIYENT